MISSKSMPTYRRSRAGHEDQTTQIGRAFVTQRASGVDQSTDTVGLDGGADEGGSIGGSSTGGLLRLGEFLLRVGGLGTVVGIAENRGHDGERGGVGEDCA